MKKEVLVTVRIDSNKRKKFLKICKEEGTTGASKLREYIYKYIRNYEDKKPIISL